MESAASRVLFAGGARVGLVGLHAEPLVPTVDELAPVAAPPHEQVR